jgi:hypothetical protein
VDLSAIERCGALTPVHTDGADGAYEDNGGWDAELECETLAPGFRSSEIMCSFSRNPRSSAKSRIAKKGAHPGVAADSVLTRLFTHFVCP